jgi:cysteinyl-tRNA synthetase
MKLYNTITRKKEEFIPITGKNVNMYVCGITPYNHCHIGHARCYVVFDVIRRYLAFSGYNVNYVQNFTDIDDKIINSANKENIQPIKFAERYIKSYFEDMKELNVLKAIEYPKVSENISEIILFINKIIENGYAYVKEGEVFFNVPKFKEYGKLSGRNLEEQLSGARIITDEKKEHPADFTLWKPAKPGEPSWDSPWGKGRPGWHIECSAMSLDKFKTETLDIHGGGQDLIFPHHENEIAQSESATNKPFVKYWMHNGFVTVNQEKMSKSLNNFFLIKDILKHYDSSVLRYFLLSVHYRSPLDFSEEHLKNAENGYVRFKNFLFEVKNKKTAELSASIENEFNELILEFERNFIKAMDDDFNTCESFGVLHKFCRNIMKQINENGFSEKIKNKILELFDKYAGKILGLDFSEKKQSDSKLSEVMDILLEIRKLARKNKHFEYADLIRNKLNELKIELRDTKEGTVYIMK